MFLISNKNNKSTIDFFCDSTSYSGVIKISDKVRKDVQRVTGFLPERIDNLEESDKNLIIFGTLGLSKTLDTLAEEKLIDLSSISGKNEVFLFQIITYKNKTTLVIAGSDKRGTIYGLFHLSDLLGVSPLVDWADAKPLTKESIELTQVHNMISKEPSVRFRGFFINDEWPAYGNWTNHNFGGFNAKMYEHVFELLLRMKGNYLWPAMWTSRFSDDGPGIANAELADELGVVMGASHHEPCCRAGEEYRYLRGPDSIYGDAWNFRSNCEGITKFWEDGLKRNGKFENVITVGMRGEADTAILGRNATLKDNIDLLRDVLKTQNKLIRENVNPDEQKVPRMLALYKEVEPYFYGDSNTKGLMGDPELEGVTLMLCDDNHGNLRTLPTPEMRNHKGGYGMYYHFDYHGSPYSYEWVNTSFLPKVKEQMSMAYDFGIRDLWIVNVGDIATVEFPLNYFLDLAYDFEKYSDENFTTSEYTNNWINKTFPQLNAKQKEDLNFIINGYTKLTNLRRTECIQSDTFNPINFNESNKTLELAERIIETATKLKNEISDENLSIFFEQVYYPACGSMNVLKLQLLAGKNHWYAKHGILAANALVEKMRSCLVFDKELTAQFDSVAGGKWHAMGWSEHIGFQHWNEEENLLPIYMTIDGSHKPRIVVWKEGSDITTSGFDWTKKDLKINDFKNPEINQIKLYAAQASIEALPYDISCDKNWISYSIEKDTELLIDSICITINRNLCNKDSDKNAKLCIKSTKAGNLNVNINVLIDANVPLLNYPKGTFIQTDKFISMEAAHYSANYTSENKDAAFKELPGYGKTLSAMKVFPTTKTFLELSSAPCLEYNFVVEKAGLYTFNFYTNPSNPVSKENKLQFAASISGNPVIIDAIPETYSVGDNQMPWSDQVTNNIRIIKANFECTAGLNTLKINPVTPGFVLEKIVINNSEDIVPESYLGVPETFRMK